jgi:nucleoside-diphosphate-sugar epimerase
MMYMPDAVRATMELMEADAEKIKIRSSYNIGAMSFTPGDIYRMVQKYYPLLEIEYKPDFRQEIADSWPQNIEDNFARNDWGWNPSMIWRK